MLTQMPYCSNLVKIDRLLTTAESNFRSEEFSNKLKTNLYRVKADFLAVTIFVFSPNQNEAFLELLDRISGNHLLEINKLLAPSPDTGGLSLFLMIMKLVSVCVEDSRKYSKTPASPALVQNYYASK